MANTVHTQSDLAAISLGNSLRAQRKKLGLTMQCIADLAGLSVGFISQVERGITTPSLGSLASLAKALQKEPRDFLTPPEPDHCENVNRKSSNLSGAKSEAYERLTTKFAGSKLHSFILNEPPGRRNEPVSHLGEEVFYIFCGAITVELDGDRKILHEGDSIHFDSQRVHSVWNHSNEKASIMWCGSMDSYSDYASPIHEIFIENPAPDKM